jgi:hypothetical protein
VKIVPHRAAQLWNQIGGLAGARWTRLTEKQLQGIAGRRARLAEQICLSYGVAPAQAERQIRRFEADTRGFDKLD